MAFTAGDSVVTVSVAGVYNIVYSVRTTVAVGASISLLVNGASVPGSSLVAAVDISQRTGYATLSLAAGDTVGIGTGGIAVTLGAGTNAFLNLARVA